MWSCLAFLLLILSSPQMNKESCLEPPQGIDLSGTRALSPEKICLLLNSLPTSGKEMKLGSVAVKGRALPLLCRFLERVQAARAERVQEAPRLKSFTFAGGLIGPEEASQVLLLLLPSLETLCLKGNRLGPDGIGAVAEGVREGKASSLCVLDLEETGLEKEGTRILCSAIKGKSLKVETLNLSRNRIGQMEEMKQLCSVLCVNSLPSLCALLLRRCGLTDMAVKPLTEAMGRGGLRSLEMLDLGAGYSFQGGFFGDLGEALRVDAVPRLRELNLEGARTDWDPSASREAVNSFFGALRATKCPPNLCVQGLRFFASDPIEWVTFGADKLGSSIRTLDLSLYREQVTRFLEGMKNGGEN
uniref:Uncharacterized protein n=1 Tax=Chromera velia CCMP2878 TaxID=1169474 RepID=A0A0G4F8R9_9ALVE|eukprot:Cvel_2960.t1-p1 / transcript=Cvel_2960.t1 / gene=Cvel_2960 / organism=Chromera_velia_CCMP2878 / gene_product=hypothetical protein / transcript_product=hypothetical protein / location=Cvel_scaffold117:57967-61116(-) / protein_length=358 / sequence_SO=supercontig / SO=protein_coding / is_pseudo=false